MTVAQERSPLQEAPWTTPEQAARHKARAALDQVRHTLHRHDDSHSHYRRCKDRLTEAIDAACAVSAPGAYQARRALANLRSALLAHEALLTMSARAVSDGQPALGSRVEDATREECGRRLLLCESLVLKWEGFGNE